MSEYQKVTRIEIKKGKEKRSFSSNAVRMRTMKSHMVALADSWKTEMRKDNLMVPSSQSAEKVETDLQVKGSLVPRAP